MGFVCCVDALQFLRELIKGSPIPSVNEQFYWSQTYNSCATIYLWVSWIEGAEYTLAISLAVIIYLTVVHRQDVTYKNNKKVALTVLAVFIVYPIVYTCIIGAVAAHSGGFKFVGSSCGPKSPIPSAIGIGQCFLVFCILSVFMGLSLKFILRAFKRADVLQSSTQKRHYLVMLRFSLIILCQTWPRVAQNANYLTIALEGPTAPFNQAAWWEATIGVLAGYYLNALVCFWGNTGLHKLLKTQYILYFGDKGATATTSSSTGSDEQTQTQKQAIQQQEVALVQMDEVKIPVLES